MTRTIIFVVVMFLASVAFYPTLGLAFSITRGGWSFFALLLVLPSILVVAAGFAFPASTDGGRVRVPSFVLLMFVASVAFYPALLFVFSIAKPTGWTHFALLHVLPGILIIAAGFAIGVLRHRDAIVRLVVLSIAGATLSPAALYVCMILWIYAFGL
jgi:hypothetical protein